MSAAAPVASRLVVGIDPGPKPGVFSRVITNQRIMSHKWHDDIPEALDLHPDLVSVEAFVIGNRTARTRGHQASKTTIAQTEWVKASGLRVLSFNAGTVKKWATDTKLHTLGIYGNNSHRRDAARHAVYAAYRTGMLNIDQMLQHL